jgi:hypothetical protein
MASKDCKRFADVEARIAAHDGVFREREKAETQAQRERELSAAAVQKALEQAATQMAENLVAALKAADSIELERVGRVRDEIAGVKLTSAQKAELQRRAQDKFENNVAQEFAKMNEFRNALEDLGKGMATRRELEVLSEAVDSTFVDHTKQISELRTAIAVGPSGLPELKKRADESRGEERALLREKREIIALQNRQIALIGTMAAVLSLIAYLFVSLLS